MSLEAESILATLDAQWAVSWPDFRMISTLEYHAMRLVVVRDDSDWAVVFDQVVGSLIDPYEAAGAGVRSQIYGPSIPSYDINVPVKRPLALEADPHEDDDLQLDGVRLQGPAGELTFRPELVGALDLRPGKVCNLDRNSEAPADVLLIRAYLATYPGSLFGELADSTATVRGSAEDVLLVATSFEHVLSRPTAEGEPDGRFVKRPSESETFRSLADAIASRDPRAFKPGQSNLDWRLWATFEDHKLGRWRSAG